MIDVAIRFIQGIVSGCLSAGILQCIRNVVPEHGLPPKNTKLFKLFFFISGFILRPDNWIPSAGLVLLIACLGAMAYTDFYTRQVYCFFYVLVAITGYGQMILFQSWGSMRQIFIYILIVFVGMLLHAYTLGDAEIFFTAAPYISLMAERNGMDGLFLMLLHYWLSMILWPVTWLFYAILKKKIETKFPMVPFIYTALIVIISIENLL